MTATTYKGYTIVTVGLSRHIYRPGTEIDIERIQRDRESLPYAPGYEHSVAAAKRWITSDTQVVR